MTHCQNGESKSPGSSQVKVEQTDERLGELYRATLDEQWLIRAREFVAKALAYGTFIDGQHFGPPTQRVVSPPTSSAAQRAPTTFSCARRNR